MLDVGISPTSAAATTPALPVGTIFKIGARVYMYCQIKATCSAGAPVALDLVSGLGCAHPTFAAARNYLAFGFVQVAITVADTYACVQIGGLNAVAVPNSATAAAAQGDRVYFEATGVLAPCTTDAMRAKAVGTYIAAAGVAQSASFPVGSIYVSPINTVVISGLT